MNNHHPKSNVSHERFAKVNDASPDTRWLSVLGGAIATGFLAQGEQAHAQDKVDSPQVRELSEKDLKRLSDITVQKLLVILEHGVLSGGASGVDVSIVPDELDGAVVQKLLSEIDTSNGEVNRSVNRLETFLRMLASDPAAFGLTNLSQEAEKQYKKSVATFKHEGAVLRTLLTSLKAAAKKIRDDFNPAGEWVIAPDSGRRIVVKEITRDLYSLAFTEPAEIHREIWRLDKELIESQRLMERAIFAGGPTVSTVIGELRISSTKMLCLLSGARRFEQKFHGCEVSKSLPTDYNE